MIDGKDNRYSYMPKLMSSFRRTRQIENRAKERGEVGQISYRLRAITREIIKCPVSGASTYVCTYFGCVSAF